MRAMAFVSGLLSALAAAGVARAVQASASATVTADSASASASPAAGDDPALPGSLVIGAEVGAIFPQPFTELDTHVAFGIELGYRLPMIGQRLEIMGAAAYSPPGNDFSDRHSDGSYQGDLRQKVLFFSLGPRFRVMDRSSPFNVTLAAGPRLFLLETTSNGSKGGQEFAEYKEQSTQIGFFVAAGGEYTLGPGALFLDLDLGWSKLPHEITGDASTGNVTPTLGYRLFLL